MQTKWVTDDERQHLDLEKKLLLAGVEPLDGGGVAEDPTASAIAHHAFVSCPEPGEAIAAAGLDDEDAPPASADDLAAIALLCGADDGQAAAILKSDDSASGADAAP